MCGDGGGEAVVVVVVVVGCGGLLWGDEGMDFNPITPLLSSSSHR